jgi:hypothetical protein
VLVTSAVVAGLILTSITMSPENHGSGVSGLYGTDGSPGASTEPLATASDIQSVPSAIAAGDMRTVTGGLTILSSGQGSSAADSIDRALDPESEPEAPWIPVQAELEALIARRESGDLSPRQLLDAYESIGCVGSGEFSDFAPGLVIDILDEQGEIIASGALQVGSLAGLDPVSGCRLPFTIVSVPTVDRYVIDVGGATLSYTREQLDARDWNIELQFGARS